MRRATWIVTCCLLLAATATAGDELLTVTGTGKPGTVLTFEVTTQLTEPHRVAFLGISRSLGRTEFPFVTLDLAMPIQAYGMGSLNRGSVRHRVLVPGGWPPGQTITLYAQAVIVTPKGGGHTATTTRVIKFVVRT